MLKNNVKILEFVPHNSFVCACAHPCAFMSLCVCVIISDYFNLVSAWHRQGHMEGGFLGFQETPFDSKTISKITCLNQYMFTNILASYAYLSANTI